jgi:hypothetical protein
MVVSVHLADVGRAAPATVLLRPPRPADVPGLAYLETTTGAALGEPLLPPTQLGRVGMIAAWDDEDALDRFSDSHPFARHFDRGWRVRLQPLRVFGRWAGMEGLPARALPVEDEEPVGILTLGRLRLRRLRSFRASASPAERDAIDHPALLAGTGLARPPRLVATFSLWRSAAEMRAYATADGGTHEAAMEANRARAFHHESAFIRFRPYASEGLWDGRDPLRDSVAAAYGTARRVGTT